MRDGTGLGARAKTGKGFTRARRGACETRVKSEMKRGIDGLFGVEDSGIKGMCTYESVAELLLIWMVGLLCGLEDPEQVQMFAKGQMKWLRRFMPFEQGIPSVSTLKRILCLIEPKHFAELVAAHSELWAQGHDPQTQGNAGDLAIDGKCLRGASKKKEEHKGLYTLNVAAHRTGVMFSHAIVQEKSNEITAIPELLKLLDIKGATVTIDAAGTQVKIADQIIAQQGQYLLALKGNQGTLCQDVGLYCADPSVLPADTHSDTSFGHGRIEERTARVYEDLDWLKKIHPQWSHIQAIVRVEGCVTDKKNGKTTIETRYYISSQKGTAEDLGKKARRHWTVEKNHWILDVIFREDTSRYQKNAAINLSLLRKMTLNLLLLQRPPEDSKDKEKPRRFKIMRYKAHNDEAYREALLAPVL